ncbi:DUF1178 family protein [Chthonobacter albigriseus]|uniref:DUF1178 family protein n=1 Tax=Chthonobacter albigriseus TaxID=1683161 RepID=UPI0015EED882|nr:DUF1178 family protein [Chthonobacter albigriseus]
MISFTLCCSKGHHFDAWFRSSEDYDVQRERGLLSCPSCGSGEVGKGLMAPAVRTAERAEAVVAPLQLVPAPPQAPVSAQPSPAASAFMQAAMASPEGQEILGRLRELKAKLTANSEDVGSRFVEEARKIHYGEAPERAVHGQASLDDARALLEEGVEIMPLPVLPEERN